MTVESISQPLLLSTRKHRQQFDQEPLTVAQIAGCKSVGISGEKTGTSVGNIETPRILELLSNVDGELLKAVVEEKDNALLDTTTFSEPDFGGNNSGKPVHTAEASTKPKTKSILRDTTNRIRNQNFGPIKLKDHKDEERKSEKKDKVDVKTSASTKPKTKSILQGTTNTIRNLKVGPIKGKNLKDKDEKNNVNVKADGDKKVLDQPKDGVPTKAKDRLSFKRKTKSSAPVIDSKSERTPVTKTKEGVDNKNLSTSKEEEPSFMTASFSLDDSVLSSYTPDGKRQEDKDSLFFLCGLKDMVMLELHCHTPVHDTADFVWKNYVVKMPQHINSLSEELMSRIENVSKKSKARTGNRESKSALL
ncbi:hypothetical protein ACHAWT_009511 [Skeletonema menzelii]